MTQLPRQFQFILLIYVFFFILDAQASEYETVISEDSFSTSSRIVIDEQQIRDSKVPNITTLLQSQANISISNTAFQPNSIFLRGGDSSHILILVDGVPYYDSTTIQRTTNLNTIDIRSIRRIEILKGSQSVLYGGQALSAVIKIETFPAGIKSSTAARFAGGSNNLQQMSGAILQSLNESDALLLRGQYVGKSNPSPLTESKMRYPSRLSSADVDYLHRQEESDILLKASASSDISEAPQGTPLNFAPIDSRDFKISSDQLHFAAIYKNSLEFWKPKAYFSFQDSQRQFHQPINEYSTDDSLQDYSGTTLSTRLELSPIQTNSIKLDVGLSYTKETLLFLQSRVEAARGFNESRGVFAKVDFFISDNVTFLFGLREDFINGIDPVITYQTGLSFFNKTKLEIATGFKTASLFQLYSSYGNLDLQPEKSQTLSLTQDAELSESQNFSATIYETYFSNLISIQGSPSRYYNVANSLTRGVEATYSINLKDTETQFFVSLGYQEPRDIDNARWLSRRPLQSGSIKAVQTMNKNLFSLEVFGNGEKIDRETSTSYVTLSSFIAWNATLTHSFTDKISLFFRGNNIFDNRYEDSYGYHTEGENYQLGFDFLN